MRILVAGATGVLGRATLPHLDGHDVVGLTRTRAKLEALRALGAYGVVCDVYDYERLLRVAEETKPQVVVNFLSDLSSGVGEANNRVRREGGSNLARAAMAVEARRLVVESVSFRLEGSARTALEEMERTALISPLEVLILRFARLWGPGTWHSEPDDDAIHVDEAGAQAAKLLTSAPPGTYVIAWRTSLTRHCDEARAVSGLPFSVLSRRCSGDDNPRDRNQRSDV
jgi:nucleoside-diphosphate-sugar epimerase